MGTALDKEVGRIAKKIEERLRQQSSGNGGPLIWRGHKVIPADDWRDNFLYPAEEALNFLPDDYFPYPFLPGAQPPEHLKPQFGQWHSDYIDLMEHTKNANYGRGVMCRDCILNPGQLKSSQPTSYFEDVLIKKLNRMAKEDMPNNDHSNAKQPLSQIEVKYPCPVLNRFECPYKSCRHTNDEILNLFGHVSKTVSAAIEYAKLLTYYNDATYHANFRNGAVTTINRHGGKAYAPPGSLELEFGNLKLSKVPIRRIIDVYNVLTNPSALAAVLEQYFAWRQEGKSRVEGDKKIIDMIVDFVVQFKDIMGLDDFVDYHSDAIQVENKWLAYAAKECPPPTPHGKCRTCGVEANIHCISCNEWVCVDHWRLHKENRHMK